MKRTWHVSDDMWYQLIPGFAGNPNVGYDIVCPLVSSDLELGAGNSAYPEAESFVVERVIGQYLVVSNTETPVNAFLHHRIYPVEQEFNTFALRGLEFPESAETDFLWHRVEKWWSNQVNNVFGSWEPVTGAVPFQENRLGHFDVKVNRRLRQGECLIFHTQVVGGIAPPTDNTYFLQMWARALVRS